MFSERYKNDDTKINFYGGNFNPNKNRQKQSMHNKEI